MTYLVTAIIHDRARFFDVQSDGGLGQIAKKYPAASPILYVAKTERARSAPAEGDLFNALVGRIAPAKLDGGWYNLSEESARRVMLNVLGKTDASIKVYSWEKREGKKAEDTFGYVYAFFHEGKGWIKVGMTDKNTIEACRGRIRDYIKVWDLPSDGWEYVTCIASQDAFKLEQAIHGKLKNYRVTLNGKRPELFTCGIRVYITTLEALDNLIENDHPFTDEAYKVARAAREAEERAKREAELAKREAELAEAQAERTRVREERLRKDHEAARRTLKTAIYELLKGKCWNEDDRGNISNTYVDIVTMRHQKHETFVSRCQRATDADRRTIDVLAPLLFRLLDLRREQYSVWFKIGGVHSMLFGKERYEKRYQEFTKQCGDLMSDIASQLKNEVA